MVGPFVAWRAALCSWLLIGAFFVVWLVRWSQKTSLLSRCVPTGSLHLRARFQSRGSDYERAGLMRPHVERNEANDYRAYSQEHVVWIEFLITAEIEKSFDLGVPSHIRW
jgi:hypothetical protein